MKDKKCEWEVFDDCDDDGYPIDKPCGKNAKHSINLMKDGKSHTMHVCGIHLRSVKAWTGIANKEFGTDAKLTHKEIGNDKVINIANVNK